MPNAQTPDGKSIVVTWPTEGERLVLFSPNWCDRTTWYSSSTYVADEVAVQSVENPNDYRLAHQNVIDTCHGKLSQEDFLKDEEGRSFLVVVKVAGVVLTERAPGAASGGDYEIDYAAGVITFFSAPTEAPVVTYHYETGSGWKIKPPPGKAYWIKSSEVQFTSDVDITTSVIFQAYGLVDHFAPELVEAQVIPSGTKIPLGDASVYKTIQDYINEANGSYPVIPAIGGPSWRGMPQNVHTFPWAYQAMIQVTSAYGMEVLLSLQGDIPFGGYSATATFYVLVTDA